MRHKIKLIVANIVIALPAFFVMAYRIYIVLFRN